MICLRLFILLIIVNNSCTATGEIYEGGWSYGARNGRGICLYNDGLLYEGNWLNNKEHGKGQLMTADRRLIYSGDWLDGCFHGYGTYYYSNGDRYVGDWRESHRVGEFVGCCQVSCCCDVLYLVVTDSNSSVVDEHISGRLAWL